MNNIKTRTEMINESIFRRTFEERLTSLKREIFYSIELIEKLTALANMPGQMNNEQSEEFNNVYSRFFQSKLDISKKFMSILNMNNLTQDKIDNIVFQWKRYQKQISKGTYNLYRMPNGDYGSSYNFLKKTLPLLNSILEKFDELKTNFNIDVDTEDKYTIIYDSDTFYRINTKSEKNKIEKKRKEKNAEHQDVDPYGEEQW